MEATNEGNGQGVTVVSGGLARGAGRRALTTLEFQGLAAVPAEAEWFANIDNPRTRRGVLHLRVHGKGGKVRYLSFHPGTAELVTDYLEAAGHGEETAAPLFRPVKNNMGGTVEGAITADGIYKMVKYYTERVGVSIEGFGAHSLRATAATNALDHQADIAKVQEWLGYANIATTLVILG